MNTIKMPGFTAGTALHYSQRSRVDVGVIPQVVHVVGCGSNELDTVCQTMAIPLGIPCEFIWWNRGARDACYQGLLIAHAPWCARCSIFTP